VDWLVEFNPDKCEVIRITNRRKRKIFTNYSVQEHQLKKVKGAKYIGLTIDRTLSWNDHISNVTKKANNTRAFLQRNINRCPEAIKTLCYQTFVRPIVEYVSTVCNPPTEKNIKSVENVQRQAARFVKSDYRRRSSVTTMLESLKWVTLASRRAEAKLVMLYRITNNLVDVTTSALTAAPTRTRGNTHRYLQPSTCIEAYAYSFFPSTVVTKQSFDSFRRHLHSMPT
jgi:hypothetical protein